MECMKKIFILGKTHGIQIAVLIFLVVAAYANSIGNAFISDDFPSIAENPLISNPRFIVSIPFVTGRYFIFYILHALFGSDPSAYRIMNILFHLGSTILVYAIVSKLHSRKLAFPSAAIFAVHPLAVESVTWISGGGYAQYAFFFLLSFFLYLLNNRTAYVYSVISYTYMIISSEKSLPLFLLFPLYEFCMGNLRQHWRRIIPYAGISIAWICFFGFQYVFSRLHALETDYYTGGGLYNSALQIPVAIITYLTLFVFPVNLSFYQSELFQGWTIYTVQLVVFLLFCVACFIAYRKKRTLFFYLMLFFTPLLPSLTPLPLAWVVAERYVYLGIAGLSVVSVLLFFSFPSKFRNKYLTVFLFVCVIGGLLTRTVIRNNDWRTSDTMWLALGKTAPSDPKTHNNLGDYYGRHGDNKKAIEEFKLAIALKPNYPDAYHNLGNIYIAEGNRNEAKRMYQKALSYNPRLWQSRMALAGMDYEDKNYEASLRELDEVKKIQPNNPDVLANIGIIYIAIGKIDMARSMFAQSLAIDPNNISAQSGMKVINK